MRPALAVRIENAVAVDDLVIFIFEHGEIEAAGESLLQLLREVLRFVMGVDTDRQDLDSLLFLLGQKAF